MTTTEAPVRQPKPEKPVMKSLLSQEDVKNAIKTAFPLTEGTISIRHLWTIESVHRYRVNWWGSDKLYDSKFLHITQGDVIEVKEKSGA